MIFAVPPDPKSLSLDLFNSDNRFVKFLIKPPEEKEEDIPEFLKKKDDSTSRAARASATRAKKARWARRPPRTRRVSTA